MSAGPIGQCVNPLPRQVPNNACSEFKPLDGLDKISQGCISNKVTNIDSERVVAAENPTDVMGNYSAQVIIVETRKQSVQQGISAQGMGGPSWWHTNHECVRPSVSNARENS